MATSHNNTRTSWNRTHGRSGKNDRTYRIWMGIRHRCTNPNASHYEFYGGRGIRVCERWASFEDFLTDMGECPSGHSIDRIDFNGDYTPENCRWATLSEQMNNRSNCIRVTMNNQTQTLAQWARELGMDYKLVHRRVHRDGWAPVRALTTPPKYTFKR